MMRTRSLALLILLLAASSETALGQSSEWMQVRDWAGQLIQAPRAELQDSLVKLESLTRSADLGDKERSIARIKESVLRERLREGDFQMGDAILLAVQHEPQLSDTFTVSVGLSLDLRDVGHISLRGVLVSELEEHLTKALGRYLREPTVKAQRLIRVSVVGAVNEPGYHLVSPDVPFANFLMQNGLRQEADFARISIQRGGEVLLAGADLNTVILSGRSVDELGLRTGDQVTVLEKPGRGRNVVATFLLAVGTAATVVTVTELIRR